MKYRVDLYRREMRLIPWDLGKDRVQLFASERCMEIYLKFVTLSH